MVVSQLTYLSNTVYVGVSCAAGRGAHRPLLTFCKMLQCTARCRIWGFLLSKRSSWFSLCCNHLCVAWGVSSRSYLDMSKVIIFSYLFWFVLTIIFITGTTRISIFCMGYLVACFYFLLFGGDLLLKPIKSILRYWDWLIAYNVFVITMKNILSVSGSCCITHLWFQCKNKQPTRCFLKAPAQALPFQASVPACHSWICHVMQNLFCSFLPFQGYMMEGNVFNK